MNVVFQIFAQGAHYGFSDDLYLGGMIQFDRISQSIGGGGSISGRGFMAGPYLVAKHPDHPLYAESDVGGDETDTGGRTELGFT